MRRPPVRVALGAWLAAVLALFAYIARYHEFWRDEVQPALVARAVPLLDLVPALRREGIPPVIHLVNKLVGGLPPPYSLAAVGAIGSLSLLFGTYRLLLATSGSPERSLVATAALALTDTYSYELGVVVRQYGLGLGFAFACFAYLGEATAHERPGDARRGALFGALAVLTSIHPGCLAGSALLAYALERLAKTRTVRSVATAASALPAFLFAWFVIQPYDRAPELLIVFHRSAGDAVNLLGSSLFDGSVALGWWDPHDAGAFRWTAVLLAWVGLAGVAWTNRLRAREAPWVAAYYAGALALNTLTLAYVFVVRNPGKHRHHLFLVLPALVAGLGLLLRRDGARRHRSRPALPAGAVAACFAPWFAFEYWTAATDLAGDVRGSFSATKAAAEVLPPDARVVGVGEDWVACALLYWRPDLAMRAQSSKGRPFRYLYQDWWWHHRVPIEPLLAEECGKTNGLYLVLPEGEPRPDMRCATELVTPPSLEATERFTLARLDCSCYSRVSALEARDRP